MHEKLTQTDQEIISDGKNDEQINYASNDENEAISAMVNLGYDKNISTRIVAKVCSENSELEISGDYSIISAKDSGQIMSDVNNEITENVSL